MRISGGTAGGIPLQVPKGVEIRPATDANRERLFSSLGEFVIQCSFLDLFAGTGSYGLEALSRGAKQGTFVEFNRKCFGALKKNGDNVCKSANIEPPRAILENREVIEFLRKERSSFDIIFLDPPYSLFPKIGPQIFQQIKQNKMLKENGLLIHEAPGEEKSDFIGWKLLRTIGKSKKGSPLFRIFQLDNQDSQS